MADERAWVGAIQSPADVRRVLAEANAAGLQRAGTAALAQAVVPARDTEVGGDAAGVLPAPAQLRALLPWPGLRRGATIAAVGSASVLLLLLGAAMREGSYAAVVGVPQLGALAAAQDYEIPLDRLALVPNPGPDWPTVVGALLDGVDLVVVATPGGVADGTVRSLQARARQRGAVLIPTSVWPGCDVVIEVAARRWEGLGQGRWRLRRQHLELRAAGRGRAAQPRTAAVTVPPHQAELRWLQHAVERRRS